MMRYVNDEFNQEYGDIDFDDPVQAMDQVTESKIDELISTAVQDGYDFSNPVLMGNFIDDFFAKIKDVTTKIVGNDETTVKISTGGGTATIGPDGVSYTKEDIKTVAPGTMQVVPNSIQTYLKNPYVIAALVGIPVLYLLTKKKKGSK